VFVRPMQVQVEMYKKFMASKAVKQLLNGNSGSNPLRMVTLLKKLCNHPALLDKADLEEVKECLPSGFSTATCQVEHSSKFVRTIFRITDSFVVDGCSNDYNDATHL